MPPVPPDLTPYLAVLTTWMPGAETRAPKRQVTPGRFDALLVWRGPRGVIRYLIDEKRTLPNQDIQVVIDQLKRWQQHLPRADRGAKLLLVAPTVRPHQAAALEHAGIDYLDRAGNAHLDTAGIMVHVEGRQPASEPLARRGRPNKGWIKTVLTILVRPELVEGPYRPLAEQAQVALGTVAGCMSDLAARGLVHRGKDGRHIPDRQQLVALWVQAYVDVLRPRLQERRFQIRAADKAEVWERLHDVLGKRGVRWALTGADAAERRTHFFRAEETELYAPIGVFDDRTLQNELIAQPAARGGNLLVIEPPAPVAIPPATGDDPPMTPDLLAFAELRYRGTAQALEAAELVLPAAIGDDAR